jgi:hypothetical protein
MDADKLELIADDRLLLLSGLLDVVADRSEAMPGAARLIIAT